MDDVAIARALHLLAVIHWIGGVSLVTAVILPGIARFSEPSRRIAIFEEIEGRFSFQAKISVTLAGVSGRYMTHRLDAWDRFADMQFWWMHAMVAVWAVFTFILFVAEPLFLHDWFRRRAAADPEGAFGLVQRAHWGLPTLSAATIVGAALGARGAVFWQHSGWAPVARETANSSTEHRRRHHDRHMFPKPLPAPGALRPPLPCGQWQSVSEPVISPLSVGSRCARPSARAAFGDVR